MKKTLLTLFFIIVIVAIYIGIKKTSDNSTLTPPPPIGESSNFTFSRTESCTKDIEDSCRILAENKMELISFKIDYRYRDILSKNFSIIRNNDCIVRITLPDSRVLDFNCLKFFSRPKNSP